MATESVSTIKSSSGDYTSLSNWEAGEQADLVTADIIAVAECYAFEDTTALTIVGWTVDSTRYIEIRPESGDTPDQQWSTSRYRLAPNNATGITISQDYTKIKGIQLYQAGTDGIKISNVNYVEISDCILKGDGASRIAIWNYSGENTKIWNTIIYGWTGSGLYGMIYNDDATSSIYVYNTSVYLSGNGYAFQRWNDNTFLATNCVGFVTGTGTAFHNKSTGSFTGDYNAGSDASAPGANSLDNQTTGDIDWVSLTVGSEDFAIESTSSLKGSGDADPGSGLFSDDIVGTSRPQGTDWDIGAFEYVSAASGNPFYYYAQQ